jgi:hypothetical protein
VIIREPRRLGLKSALASSTAPTLIALSTAVYLAIGLVMLAGYRITGNDAWVIRFFEMPGALLSLFLRLVATWFTLCVFRQFGPQEPMRAVWLCLLAAAVFDVAGILFSQIFAAETALNPLVHAGRWSEDIAVLMREYGLLLGGTFRFALLACALVLAMKVFRGAGLRVRLRPLHWFLWAAMGAYLVREIMDVIVAYQQGTRFRLAVMAGWPVDFLLWFSLAVALQLHRSASQMGSGWIGRCWKAFAWGVFLICLGVVALWATNYGYLPWPWSALTWYIWLPAGAAFAIAPAYQLEAMRRASAPPY